MIALNQSKSVHHQSRNQHQSFYQVHASQFQHGLEKDQQTVLKWVFLIVYRDFQYLNSPTSKESLLFPLYRRHEGRIWTKNRNQELINRRFKPHLL